MPLVKTQNKIFIIKPVPGLAGMELNFFIEACMVLSFGFVAKTVLITHRYFSKQVSQADRIEVLEVDLDRKHKSELFVAQ